MQRYIFFFEKRKNKKADDLRKNEKGLTPYENENGWRPTKTKTADALRKTKIRKKIIHREKREKRVIFVGNIFLLENNIERHESSFAGKTWGSRWETFQNLASQIAFAFFAKFNH